MSEIITVAKESSGEYEEKRSRFICVLTHVESESDALAFVEQVKKQHYDARHNCWAYLLRNGSKRYSDDGEPQGTAGVPILDALEKSGLCDVAAVVTRYFGGVLLGAGGLVRAYSKAVGEAIRSSQKCKMQPCEKLSVTCDYPFLSPLKRLIAKYDGSEDACEYGENVTQIFTLPKDGVSPFSLALTEASAGKVGVTKISDTERPILL